MSRPFVFAALGILLVAIVTQQPALLAVVLLLMGLLLFGRAWPRISLRAVQVTRRMPQRAFLDEAVPVTLDVHNTGLLPATWLNLRDSIPVELGHEPFEHAISMRSYEQRTFDLSFKANRRGLYEIGPLTVTVGDVMGLGASRQRSAASQSLTVYPRIVNLEQLELPSRLLLGNRRHTQPIHDDPSRLRGKRDYVHGDSLRRVDWKTTAALGRLQVKQFEPSRVNETTLLLDLDLENYDRRVWVDETELAIVVAASIGNWCAARNEAVGLMTNGRDPGITASLQYTRPAQSLAGFAPVPPRAGRASFMRVLDVLARMRTSDLPTREGLRTESLAMLARTARNACTWGSTLVVITGAPSDPLWHELVRAPSAGLSVLMALCGAPSDEAALRNRAAQFGIALHVVRALKDLAR